MFPGRRAEQDPDRPATIMAGGRMVTWAELEAGSNRLARYLHDAGLRRGDHVAVMLENHPLFHEVVWGALRSGLILTSVNRHLTAAEAEYIVDDCGARALVTSAGLAGVAAQLRTPRCDVRLMLGGSIPGYDAYEEAVSGCPSTPPVTQPLGDFMLYSSGTTGRPKGIRSVPARGDVVDGHPLLRLIADMFGIDRDTVYLSPAPLYHSAPLGFTTAVQMMGGTVVIMEEFDPEEALALIERHRVTLSQWVPTMFSRMLKLPDAVRERYDLSSHRMAVHAAAPCPRSVKEAMFEWWGPILHEYYGSTEPSGVTYCSPQDWLAHPGTVGRPVKGILHICDEDGAEVPMGEVGTIFFEQGRAPFEYHNSTEETRRTRHPRQATWTTVGDVGHVDEEGFLFLTDRTAFMIISGGVNIAPREIEDVLIVHPLVEDVAVIGVPDDDLGEAVKAVVQVRPGAAPGPELEEELIGWCRERLSRYKCPRSVDFTDALPRLPTGKLAKRLLRDGFWAGRSSRLV